MFSCKNRSKWLLLVGIGILLGSFNVRAGGILFPELGTVSLGRGGAFVARADNLSAFYYNPAGLSKSKGINILGSANLVDVNVDYLRQGGNSELGSHEPGSEWFPHWDYPELMWLGNPSQDYSDGMDFKKDFERVSSQTPIAPSGAVVVVNWGDAFNVEGLSLALGLVAPSADPFPKYPSNGAQRYSLVKMSAPIIYPGIGVSYALNRYFQIGAVFLSGIAPITFEQKLRMAALPDDWSFNEDAIGDASATIELFDPFIPSGVVGVLSNPIDWLEIGVSMRIPMYISADGDVDLSPPTGLDLFANTEVVEGYDKATLEFHFPWTVSGGVRFIHRIFDIEADFVWENWSTFKGLDVLFDLKVDLYGDEVSIIDMPDVHVPKNFRSTYSVRLGSDIEVWPENLTARLGGFFQSSAYPKSNNTFSVMFPNGQQFGVGCGLTWHTFEFLYLNVGYLHIFQPQVTVKDGIVQQVVGQSADASPNQDGSELILNGNTVNNGIYDVNMNLFAASFEVHF